MNILREFIIPDLVNIIGEYYASSLKDAVRFRCVCNPKYISGLLDNHHKTEIYNITMAFGAMDDIKRIPTAFLYRNISFLVYSSEVDITDALNWIFSRHQNIDIIEIMYSAVTTPSSFGLSRIKTIEAFAPSDGVFGVKVSSYLVSLALGDFDIERFSYVLGWAVGRTIPVSVFNAAANSKYASGLEKLKLLYEKHPCVPHHSTIQAALSSSHENGTARVRYLISRVGGVSSASKLAKMLDQVDASDVFSADCAWQTLRERFDIFAAHATPAQVEKHLCPALRTASKSGRRDNIHTIEWLCETLRRTLDIRSRKVDLDSVIINCANSKHHAARKLKKIFTELSPYMSVRRETIEMCFSIFIMSAEKDSLKICKWLSKITSMEYITVEMEHIVQMIKNNPNRRGIHKLKWVHSQSGVPYSDILMEVALGQHDNLHVMLDVVYFAGGAEAAFDFEDRIDCSTPIAFVDWLIGKGYSKFRFI